MRVIPSLCLLVGSSLLTSTEANKIMRAPIHKISHNEPQVNGDSNTLAVNFLSQPTLEMRNNFDYSYISTINVGENEKPFNIILDSGSSTFWIPHSQLSKNHSHTYDCSQSKFCKGDDKNIQDIKYGEGSMTGFVVKDRVKIGDAVLDDFQFLLATKTEFKNHDKFDGILGLSPVNGKGDSPTVLKRMKDAGIIDKMQFSMYLGSQTYSRGAATGEIIFGGSDSKFMREGEEFQYITAKQGMPHWTTSLHAIGIGAGVNISEGTTDVIIDSGTSLIYMPESYITNILREAQKKGIKCGFDKQHSTYGCDCKARTILPPMFVYFENLTLSIPATSYIEALDNKCFLTVRAHEDKSRNLPNILGDVFLKNYYTLYDMDNHLLGFAQAAPVSHWKNWLLAGLIFGSMALIWLLLHFILRDRSKSNADNGNSRSNNSGGGLFSRGGNQGVAIGGGSGNTNRSRLLENQEMN